MKCRLIILRLYCHLSLSSRRAWIEMLNLFESITDIIASLSSRRAWIEICVCSIAAKNKIMSLSSRRAWIEMPGGTHYIKKVSHRTLIFQVLCCFLLFLLHFCHMALEACFHIFGVKRFDDTNTVVINVDNLIPLAVKIAGG